MTERLAGGARPFLTVLLAAFALALGGCHGHGGGGGGKEDAGPDGKACAGDAGARMINGASCGCNADCASGFCVDTVCCETACTEACKSCNTPSAPGLCSLVAAGGAPRVASACPAGPVASCGLDGTCDGQGGCRSYTIGTVCQAGTCNGVAVSGIRVCDGAGDCTSGPSSLICAPFNCDTQTNSCVVTCASDSDCAANTKCVAGSCGLRPIGGACTGPGQCASGFCADDICCNSTCTGPCVSCNQSGRLGTCEPTALGAPDPHEVCATTDRSTCGQTGSCDGIGGCAKYAAETICLPPTCSGNRENTAGTCDGLGTCRAQGVQECGTYECTGGACINHCASDNDCVAGHSCVSGSCGPKSIGQPCSAGTECASTYCVDGVCCNSNCTGACHSCALSTSLGTCAPSPAGNGDPHKVCLDQPATSCGTDGTCDGAGNCHKYPTGTQCASESCATGIYTPPSVCDANGNCNAPDALGCAPYVCDGTRCFSACTDSTDCSTGNVCTNSSCGLKPIGAFCSTNAECQSTVCAQGVCCATACSGACQSCAVSGAMGQCTAVASGPDPAGTCTDRGAASCNTDGKCQTGACEKYQQGTSCQDATCPSTGTSFTPGGTCDGAGTCVVPAAASCFPFACGSNACKATCSVDGDCAMPASCISGSCGLKPNGAVCSGGTECKNGVCAQGVCCATACNGTCMSCALSSSGAAGTCTPVAAGSADPAGQCTDQGAAHCGTTGFCDGNGACALYVAGTQCAGPSCPSGSVTDTLARACDGSGTCKPASTQTCSPFACNAATGIACVSVCAGNSDCATGNVCNAGTCGLKRLGQLCAAGSECDSGNCVDGVCCSVAICGNCQVCNLTGNAGTCQPVAAGNVEPHGGCASSPQNPQCGTNGTCNGNGACAFAANGTSCGTASCTGSTDTPAGGCDGNGTCVQPGQSCGAYVCSSGGCLTACASDGDCTGGDTCQAGSCTNLKPLGSSCTAGAQCLSTLCTDGVCCSSGPCGSCQSCAVSGTGSCAPVGTIADPAGVCLTQGAASCGMTGLCDGAGHCAEYPPGTACAAAGCQGSTSLLNAASACDGAGHCAPASTTDCSPFACAGATCNTGCAQPSDCASGYACAPSPDGGPGTCVPSG
jgi:hypothetical protein